MAERAVFLDRDNTIIDNDGYLGDPTKVRLLTGAATALSAIRALGYRLIVVSNQSGVARGMFDEAAVEAVNQEMCRQLREQANAHIDASYYCPYHPDATIVEYKLDHDWRKPKPGMIRQAAIDFKLDLSQCWVIGDMPRDIAAGAAAGCRTILLKDPEHPAPEHESNSLNVSPNFIVKTLADAARIIAREGKVHPARPAAQASPPAAPQPYSPPPAAPAPEPAPAPPPPLPAITAVDESALANKVAARVAQSLDSPQSPAHHLERTLEDLVTQLRQQNRNADLRDEFPISRLAALILQLLAALCAFVGLFTMIGAKATFTADKDRIDAGLSLERAIVWLLIAVFLQGLVISLQMNARKE